MIEFPDKIADLCSHNKSNQILDLLDKKKNVIISDTTDSAKPLIISRLLDTPSNEVRAVFWFAKNEKEAVNIQKRLSFFCKICNFQINSAIFPVFDEDEISNNDKIALNQVLYKITRSDFDVFIIPIDACATEICSLKAFSDYIIKIEPNDTINLELLIKKLSDIGYERQDFAAKAGTFSVRGDIMDIFTINNKYPIRIEFIGNKIEKIYSFDPQNKSKINNINFLDIVPIDVQDKTCGNLIDYIEFNKNISENRLYIFDEPGELSDNLEFIDPLLWKRLQRLSNNEHRINFESLPPEGNNIIRLNYQNSPIYYYDLNKFKEDIKDKLKNKWKILFLTENKDKIEPIIQIKSPLIHYIENKKYLDYIDGFVVDKKSALITDKEIFGIKITKKLKKDIKFISELKENDYIVHYDHGIGKFIGMAKRKIDEGVREFFILEYAKGDKLFLPVEYSEKITKYIGATHPKVHRLHEASWSQVRAKVKEKAEKIAKDLVAIYAQRKTKKGFIFSKDNEAMKDLYESFPYRETDDQTRVWDEVKNDMEKNISEKPMDRLICGDVGFGKTEIAIRAAMKATIDNKQVALLCPTTILAQQHYDTFSKRLENFNLKVDVLSRFKNEKQQRETIENLALNNVNIIIGTHRLLSQDIVFKDLGLLIIDEEQKFGVKHKERIKEFKANVDILTLTATPIPRTLNLSLSGLRDISTIETPPEGRRSVKTIIKKYDNNLVKIAIQRELDRQGQVYYLHNRVATIQAAAKKVKLMFPKARIDIAHGQLTESRLADVMHRFDKGEIDILVSSSIIENGLDLPNANTLIVSKSTNFGLSSLYQLRGRIGRSHKKAYAYFLYQDHDLTEQARKRLQALMEAKELGAGFKLALRDLEIRGVGNILGKEQSGNVTAIGLNLYTRLLNKAVKEIQTGVKREEVDVSIDLPLSAYIPKDYIKDEKKRIFTYQEIANLTELNELNDFKQDLPAKFKQTGLPQTLNNLFDIIEIKILAKLALIENIDTKIITKPTGEKLQKVIITPFKEVDYSKARELLKINPNWEVYEKNLKIEMEYLGVDWINNLKLSLKALK